MARRILITEPNADLRTLLELKVRRMGYETVGPGAANERPHADAILLEPGCPAGRSLLDRFGEHVPPVICLSNYPREAHLAPPETVAYLVKPSTTSALAAALDSAF